MCEFIRAYMLPKIKKKITLPKDWFSRTPDSIMFTYHYKGWEKPRFFVIERGEDAGELFKEEGIISRYQGIGKTFKMYKRTYPTDGFNWVESELDWWDVKLHDTDAIHIIASEEYNLMGGGLRICQVRRKARCLTMQSNFSIAA